MPARRAILTSRSQKGGRGPSASALPTVALVAAAHEAAENNGSFLRANAPFLIPICRPGGWYTTGLGRGKGYFREAASFAGKLCRPLYIENETASRWVRRMRVDSTSQGPSSTKVVKFTVS